MVALVMCLADIVSSVDIFNQKLQKDGLLVFEAFEHVADITARLCGFFTLGPTIDPVTNKPVPTGFNKDYQESMLHLNSF